MIATANLVGSVAFGIAAIAAYWVPTSGSVLDLAAANTFTALGGLCFLAGALLLLPGHEHSSCRGDALWPESALVSPHETCMPRCSPSRCWPHSRSPAAAAEAATAEAAVAPARANGPTDCALRSSTGLTRSRRPPTSLKGDDLSEERLKSAVDDVESATETFVDDVKGLGTPDTEAGQKAKESLDELADNLDDEVARSRPRPTTSPG